MGNDVPAISPEDAGHNEKPFLRPIGARLRGGPQTRIRSAKPAQVDVGKDVLHRRSLRSVFRLDKLAGALFDRSIHEFATHRVQALGDASEQRQRLGLSFAVRRGGSG